MCRNAFDYQQDFRSLQLAMPDDLAGFSPITKVRIVQNLKNFPDAAHWHSVSQPITRGDPAYYLMYQRSSNPKENFITDIKVFGSDSERNTRVS